MLRQAETTPSHPVLPAGVFFDQIKQLLGDPVMHLRLGLSRARKDALLVFISCTSPTDWTRTDRAPVCFRAQRDLARKMGKCVRAVRADETALEAMGFLKRDLGSDGSRSSVLRSDGTRLGLNFSCLIEMVPRLLILQAQIAAEDHAWTVLRLECTAGRRTVRELIERAKASKCPADDVAAFQAIYDAWPPRYAGYPSAADLAAHLAGVENTAQRLVQLIEMSADSSPIEDPATPPHIQPTHNPESENCSGSSASDGPAGPSPQRDKELGRVPAGDNPSDLSWFTPAMIRNSASPEFRFYLNAFAGDGSITEAMMIKAALHRVPELGINATAWDRFADRAGNLRAAIAVFVIDANRDHPAQPIRNPGGALRAFDRLDQEGRLNLAGSLIGLRMRQRE